MSLLSLVPLPYRLAAAGLALAALVGSAWYAWESHGTERFDAGVKSKVDAQAVIDAERTRVALAESEKRRQEEAATKEAQQKVIDDAERRATQARADKVMLEASSGALQRRYDERVRALVAGVYAAASHRGEGQGGAAAAGPSSTAEDAAGVLSDVFRRCRERISLLAAIADERGTAGLTCERSYDALTADRQETS